MPAAESTVPIVEDVTATDAMATVVTPTPAEDSGAAPNIDQSTNRQISNETALQDAKTQDDEVMDAVNDISDGEDVDDFAERYRTKYEDMERRRQLVPKRIKQHNQYVHILEERVSFLEERCDSFDKKLQNKGDEVTAPENTLSEDQAIPKKEPPLKPELGFKHWKDFISATPPTQVIDVLVGEPSVQKTEKFRRRKTASKMVEGEGPGVIIFSEDKMTDASLNPMGECNLSEEIDKMKSGLFPERIRFNGTALPFIFRKLFSTSETTSPDNILLRPFKPILQRFDETQEVMSDLSRALKKVIERRSDPSITDVTQAIPDPLPVHSVTMDQEEPSSAPDAISTAEWDIVLKELGLFHCCSSCTKEVMGEWPTLTAVEESFATVRELLEDYLLPAHKQFRDHKVTKVRFCDLWHLFLTGDTIITKESGNEIRSRIALKVLMTSGGRYVISTASPAPVLALDEMSRLNTASDPISPINGINPFCIHAYYLDYNGSKLVPVRRRFIIPPYPNLRSVTELEVFPIEYAGDTKKVLVKRGERFKEYVEARPAKYLDCKGLELSMGEELNDKVIVDMKGYFSTTPVGIPEFDYPESPNISETSDCFMGNDCAVVGGLSTSACGHRTLKIIPDQVSDVQVFTDYIEGRPEFNAITGAHNDQPQRETHFEICHYRLFAYKLRSREWGVYFHQQVFNTQS
jgi:hypothetical protein